jgi:squalene-associated FAD-dependent desaturase
MADRVVIVGGGLAGLAAATALAPRGFDVTLLESRGRLGGRAGSFHDVASGQLIDTCQHVSMGCCTNFAHFCRTVGIAHFLKPQPCLYFMTPDRRISRFQADALPAPFHLVRSFCRAHYLSAGEKLRIAWALACLRRIPPDADPPFFDWLLARGQTPRTVRRFWGLVLTSALNEGPERIGLRYARKVFVDGFLLHPRGFEVALPTVPLGRLYGEELRSWLEAYHVQLRMGCAAKELEICDNRVHSLELRSGEVLAADWYVVAVPFERLGDLLPKHVIEAHPYFHGLKHLECSPITSVHLWYGLKNGESSFRAVMELPHVVLVDCLGQWVFNRGEASPGEQYLQVVVSASRQFRGLGQEEVQRRIVKELAELFPAAVPTALRRVRVITEHGATFSAVPGVDRWRPAQSTPLPNLLLAGDWTATGWPATMEGAVRSGYLAAEAILERSARQVKLIQPDLGVPRVPQQDLVAAQSVV